MSDAPNISTRMTAQEKRASAGLAGIFASRMLGLFLVLPVFALEARHYAGADNYELIGLAMGIYGLTQGLLQIPYGMASDRLGRHRVIVFGLLIFAAGSVLAALAGDIYTLIAGRALQGAGAVSAAVTALLADQTRPEVRTKAMALVGSSIALMFALSLVVSPILVGRIGLAGLFWITAALALCAIAALFYAVPKGSPSTPAAAAVADPLQTHTIWSPALFRLDLGVFVLHAVQLAMWVAVPALLVSAGLATPDHAWVYLAAVLVSFVVMGAGLFKLERAGYLRAAFVSAIALVLLAQIGLLWQASQTVQLVWLAVFLCIFFCGFNVLEATQPSLVTRLALPNQRGLALGVYNSLQSLGFFAGGVLGGKLAKIAGSQGIFLACAALTAVWLIAAWFMQPVPGRSAR